MKNFKKIRESLKQGDRRAIANEVGCSYPTIQKALHKDMEDVTDLDIKIIDAAKRLITERRNKINKI